MMGRTMGDRLERSFKRTSGRVMTTLRRSPLNGRGPAALMAAIAGAAGIVAAMRFWRRATPVVKPAARSLAQKATTARKTSPAKKKASPTRERRTGPARRAQGTEGPPAS